MKHTRVSVLCLAAGRSSRMKGDHKLLKKIGGQSVIEKVAEQLSGLPVLEILYVVGGESEAIAELLARYDTRIVLNKAFASGMHSSIKVGIRSLDPRADAVLICLGDQPFDLNLRMNNLLSAETKLTCQSLVRSQVSGKPGHPVLIGRDYFEEILQYPDGDYGCSYLFKTFPFETIEQPESAMWDLDTPEDFARFGKLSDERP